MLPVLHVGDPDRHERMRFKLNRALSLTGVVVDEAGALCTVEASRTVGEAESRARALRAGLERRSVHPDVLEFCRAEWLVDDHFHAVQEAVKSVMAKLRRSEEHTSELQSLMRISYAVFFLKKKMKQPVCN